MKYNIILMVIVFYGCASAIKQEPKEFLEDEDYRPQYHFTPTENWMNDPNGMVYYNQEYHLFYQHYPEGNVWGPMHWGHAVSEDMINWKHLPIALYPDSFGYIFSGSAVIDWDNTSGLGSIENPPMVAIFTYHNPIGVDEGKSDFQTQGLAYSIDNGRTWTKYKDNPVLRNPGITDFRDPKVIWDDNSKQWTMILAVRDHVNIYSSPNLIDWTKESEFGQNIGAHSGVWECPDLFPLKSETGKTRWVMLSSINPGGPQGGSATQYFIGDFDGKIFTPQDKVTRWLDFGADNYAGVTWSDIPKQDARRLFLGWMSNWQYATSVPTFTWRSAMTIPRELQLVVKHDSIFGLISKPVKELSHYFNTEPKSLKSGDEIADRAFKLELSNLQFPTELKLLNSLEEELVISLNSTQVSIDRRNSGNTKFHDAFGADHKIEYSLLAEDTIHLYVDNSSIELFVNSGDLVMTDLFFMNRPINKLICSQSASIKFIPFSNQPKVQ